MTMECTGLKSCSSNAHVLGNTTPLPSASCSVFIVVVGNVIDHNADDFVCTVCTVFFGP